MKQLQIRFETGEGCKVCVDVSKTRLDRLAAKVSNKCVFERDVIKRPSAKSSDAAFDALVLVVQRNVKLQELFRSQSWISCQRVEAVLNGEQ